MKVKGNEVMYTSPNGYLVITYDQFALGMKYNVYRKIHLDCEDGYREMWKYLNSYLTYGEAMADCNRAYDGRMEA